MDSDDICGGCGERIHEDLCWCGSLEEDHNWYADPHPFTPMGCTCGYEKPPPNIVVEDILNNKE